MFTSGQDSTVSVVMTTHAGENSTFLSACFESLTSQDHNPDEVIIVRSRKLPCRLVKTIENFKLGVPFTVRDILIKEKGRGYARRVGVREADSTYIAIMDSDDIACPDRLSRQIRYLDANPSVALVGGYIREFNEDHNNIRRIRKVPTKAAEIRKQARFRSPVNHPTVTFRREAVLAVGNYRAMEYGEDYELCCRLLADGRKLANIPDVLVKVRAGDLVKRRRGLSLVSEEFRLQRAIMRSGFYDIWLALANLCLRIPLRLLPESVLRPIYHYILRSRLNG